VNVIIADVFNNIGFYTW